MQIPRSVYVTFAFLLRYTLGVPLWLIPVALLGLYAATGGHKFLYVFFKTIKRDATYKTNYYYSFKISLLWTDIWISRRGYFTYRRVMKQINDFQTRNMTVPAIFEETVQKHPNKICFHSSERTWSFKEVNSSILNLQ